jgi:hypothetical protein
MRECEQEVVHVKNMATTAKQRTSLDLPPDLLKRTDEAVRLGVARSRNSLIATALEDFLGAIDRTASIDARFAEMSEDAHYHEIHLTLAAGFADSDAESMTWQYSDSRDKTRHEHLAPPELVLEADGP